MDFKAIEIRCCQHRNSELGIYDKVKPDEEISIEDEMIASLGLCDTFSMEIYSGRQCQTIIVHDTMILSGTASDIII